MKIIATFAITSLLASGSPLKAQDAIIGELLGKPIHASQIKATEGHERADSLRAVFIFPAIRAYLEPHKDEIALTKIESTSIIDSYNELRACKPELGLQEMKPPFDMTFAQMIGGFAKIQRFIYLNHGRGRLLFQQAGTEAFDATRHLILYLEERGDIKFKSEADRELALAYWATQEHSGALLPDPGVDKAFQLDAMMSKCP